MGVIDGMIAVAAIHELAGAFAQRSGAHLRTLDADGALVAETESGHARDRILELSQEAMSREGRRPGEGDIKNEIPAGGRDDIARIGRGVEKIRGTMRRALQIIHRQPA